MKKAVELLFPESEGRLQGALEALETLPLVVPFERTTMFDLGQYVAKVKAAIEAGNIEGALCALGKYTGVVVWAMTEGDVPAPKEGEYSVSAMSKALDLLIACWELSLYLIE